MFNIKKLNIFSSNLQILEKISFYYKKEIYKEKETKHEVCTALGALV